MDINSLGPDQGVICTTKEEASEICNLIGRGGWVRYFDDYGKGTGLVVYPNDHQRSSIKWAIDNNLVTYPAYLFINYQKSYELWT